MHTNGWQTRHGSGRYFARPLAPPQVYSAAANTLAAAEDGGSGGPALPSPRDSLGSRSVKRGCAHFAALREPQEKVQAPIACGTRLVE